MGGGPSGHPVKQARTGGLLHPDDSWQAMCSRALTTSPIMIGLLLYFVTNRLTRFRTDTIIFAFDFDPGLPFIPSFSIIYLSYHLFMAVSVFIFLFKPSQALVLKRYAMALFWAATLSTVVFLLMPTHVPRPLLEGDSLALAGMRFIYANDQPYNCFPSMHVSWTLIASTYLQRLIGHRKLLSILNWTYMILICLSTVFTRQHYTTDVLGGLAVGMFVMAAMHWSAQHRAKRRS